MNTEDEKPEPIKPKMSSFPTTDRFGTHEVPVNQPTSLPVQPWFKNSITCERCGKIIFDNHEKPDPAKALCYRTKSGREVWYCCDECRDAHLHGDAVRVMW